jgi:hypothetical protein
MAILRWCGAALGDRVAQTVDQFAVNFEAQLDLRDEVRRGGVELLRGSAETRGEKRSTPTSKCTRPRGGPHCETRDFA